MRTSIFAWTGSVAAIGLAVAGTAGAELPVTLTISAGQSPREKVVVRWPLPAGSPQAIHAVTAADGTVWPAEVVPPGLGDEAVGSQVLVFVVPKLAAGTRLTVMAKTLPQAPSAAFEWQERPKESLDLRRRSPDGHWQPVLQYVLRPHDPNAHYLTFKPFHHLYDPVHGKTLLTSGAAASPKDGLYPHHRGLFYGFNRIRYGDRTADIWHGTNNVFSQHDESLEQRAGPVLARHRARIGWYGSDGQMFAREEREVTVYASSGGILLDWSSRLSTDLSHVRLDGDPQHAGFHFRANQEVAKNGRQNTYYLRPDGRGRVGETRNWDAKKPDPRTVNLPWNAMSFVVDGQRYTVLRIAHPANPGESRGSERDYGRFGDYCEFDLTPQKPLLLRYRLWVQAGEMTVEQCAAIAAAFRQPPEVQTVPRP